jgi:hypothetical protein
VTVRGKPQTESVGPSNDDGVRGGFFRGAKKETGLRGSNAGPRVRSSGEKEEEADAGCSRAFPKRRNKWEAPGVRALLNLNPFL